jgi:glutathione synthase/RimK-type ligase-like ATP-grasp enzyme
MIVAVTFAGDDHLPPLRQALAGRGERLELVDLAALPSEWRLALGEDPAGWALVRGAGGRPPSGSPRRLDAATVRTVWWRRVSPVGVAPSLGPTDAAFARAQYEAALGAFWRGAGIRLVDDPAAVELAELKPLQLARARGVGMAVPETLVTDDPARARAFLRRHRQAIHKPLRGTEAGQLTRPVDRATLEALEAVRSAPVIFQRFVPGVDVRVTAVGARLFGCEVDARATTSPHDFRPVFDQARVRPCAVPRPVASAIQALLRSFGLSYAALDFRRGDDGTWTFLELNPAGQWLGFAERTGQPVAEAVAALLLGEPG